MPLVDVAQHLAEKLHAYARDYGEAANSRARDLFDMLILAEHVRVAELTRLRHACKVTFELRSTPWPPVLPAPAGGVGAGVAWVCGGPPPELGAPG